MKKKKEEVPEPVSNSSMKVCWLRSRYSHAMDDCGYGTLMTFPMETNAPAFFFRGKKQKKIYNELIRVGED